MDYEYTQLLERTNAHVIISQDTGKADDPYEQFLASGRQFSKERSWSGLELEPDENANAALCYT